MKEEKDTRGTKIQEEKGYMRNKDTGGKRIHEEQR